MPKKQPKKRELTPDERRDVEIMKADGPLGEMLAVALEMALAEEFL